jgi:hypothetical protein
MTQPTPFPTPAYKIGDLVTGIQRERHQRSIACSLCGGTGFITGRGEMFQCPKCKGTKCQARWDSIELWTIAGGMPSTVGRVAVTHYGRPDKDEITYMLQSTGIGSGRVWRESELTIPSVADGIVDALNKDLITKAVTYIAADFAGQRPEALTSHD